MGTPRIYWYPDPLGSLENTDIGDVFSDIQEVDSARVVDVVAGDGTPFRDHLATVKRRRFVFERFGPVGSSELERDLKSLEAHLFKGRFIGITADHAKTWAATSSSPPTRGDTVLYCGPGTGFASWSSAGNLAEDDEVVVESAHPEAQHEVRLVDAPSGGTPRTQVALKSPIIYSYSQPTVVRWKDFYPVCWLPDDQVGKPIVTGDHRRNFTLDITLEYCLTASLALFTQELAGALPAGGGVELGLPNLRSTGSAGFGGLSLDDLLARGASAFLPSWGN